MIIALTGTPGTGKTTVSRTLSRRMNLPCLHIADLVTPELCTGYDDARGCIEVDLDRLREAVKKKLRDGLLLEGHLSHLLNVSDITIVLRTKPSVLRERLKKKGFDKDKILENLEAEALDVCLVESLAAGAEVYEVDTTTKYEEESVEDVASILEGRGEAFRPGKIDWSEEYFGGCACRRG